MQFNMRIQDNEGEVVVGCALFEDKIEIMIADHGESFNYEETKKRYWSIQ